MWNPCCWNERRRRWLAKIRYVAKFREIELLFLYFTSFFLCVSYIGSKISALRNILEPIHSAIGLHTYWWDKIEKISAKLFATYTGNPDKNWWSKIITEENFGSGEKHFRGTYTMLSQVFFSCSQKFYMKWFSEADMYSAHIKLFSFFLHPVID